MTDFTAEPSSESDTSNAVQTELFYHLTLPPSVSQSKCFNVEAVMRLLLNNLSQSLEEQAQRDSAFACAARSVAIHQEIATGLLDKTAFFEEVRKLKPNQFTFLHVTAQNAGILLQRIHLDEHGDVLLFETFEASPLAESVLAAEDALLWDFPGVSVAIPFELVQKDDNFLSSLATFLEQACAEAIDAFSAAVFKAGVRTVEVRETRDPAVITSFMTGVLETVGWRVPLPRLQKRVHDEVSLHDNKVPTWRRIPLWLVIRVALARHFYLTSNSTLGRIRYKMAIAANLCHFANSLNPYSLNMEATAQLRAKIARRLAKLELLLQDATDTTQLACQNFYDEMSMFTETVEKLTSWLQQAWENIRSESTREVPRLPMYAPPESLRFQLRRSRQVLENSLERFALEDRSIPKSINLKTNREASETSPSAAFSNQMFKLLKMDEDCRNNIDAKKFKDISQHIRAYITAVGSKFDNSLLLKSRMILTAMFMWIALDKLACESEPLLQEFHPTFYPEMMNVLHVPLNKDMLAAREIQAYLEARITKAGPSSVGIFADPGHGISFAERYYDASSSLQRIGRDISNVNERKRQTKEREWQQENDKYARLTAQIDSMNCDYLVSVKTDVLRTEYHDPYKCNRCALRDKLEKMKIVVHEDILPSDKPLIAKAVVFEINCPPLYAEYRDITWFLLTSLGYHNLCAYGTVKGTVHDYSPLRQWNKVNNQPSVTLVSFVKSYLRTHYSVLHFPTELASVFKPHAARYTYCVAETGYCPGKITFRPSFAHHLKPIIPAKSPFQAVLSLKTFKDDGSTISSYDIAANQAHCPSGVNPHEFSAIQEILSGRGRRWISILAELASSNVNFSTDAIAAIVSHVVTELGPSNSYNNVLGTTHAILLRSSFCEKLMDELEHRLKVITANWREIHLMDLIITILLKIADSRDVEDTKAIEPVRPDRVINLLREARRITRQWLTLLGEKAQTSDTTIAKQCQQYSLWSGLLCKYTYMIYAMPCSGNDDIAQKDLKTFVECSILVQNNLPKAEDLSVTLSQAFSRDLQMVLLLKEKLYDSIRGNEEVVLKGFCVAWPLGEDERCKITNATLENNLNKLDLEITTYDSGRSQTIKATYFINTGLLLINGQPRGTLPISDNNSVAIKKIFGSRSLQTYPSRMAGMEYQLCITTTNTHFHVGYDERRNMILRAYRYDSSTVLEYIEDQHFRDDLPGPLIEGHCHWLDLKVGELDIFGSSVSGHGLHARFPKWKLRLATGECFCTPIASSRGYLGTSRVMDPKSPLFCKLSRVLAAIEPPEHILVEQPANRGAYRLSISVRLPRMNLHFRVNSRGYLQASQLDAEIDPNQDAGTWYGLESKLVLRSIKSGPLGSSAESDRIILVPLGSPVFSRAFGYTSIRMDFPSTLEVGIGKFTINKKLGRIDCAPEMRLAYTKALLHAVTTGVLPDPLTGRTGIDEALAWLSSPSCRPWSPLHLGSRMLLHNIAALSPIREFYPPVGGKSLKTDLWNSNLSITAQSDQLRLLVDDILSLDEVILPFYPNISKPLSYVPRGNPKLAVRASHLRRRFETPRDAFTTSFSSAEALSNFEQKTLRSHGFACIKDRLYNARHFVNSDDRRRRQSQKVSTLVSRWKPDFDVMQDLATELSGKETIDGFMEPFNGPLLSQRFNADIRKSWGPLVAFARTCTLEHRYTLMFLLSEIAFQDKGIWDLIQSVFAFAILNDLKILDLPKGTEFCVSRLTNNGYTELWFKTLYSHRYSPKQDFDLETFPYLDRKQANKIRKEHKQLSAQAEKECRRIAEELQCQWPSETPDFKKIEGTLLINLDAAQEEIELEWTKLNRNYTLCTFLANVNQIVKEYHTGWKYQADVSPLPPVLTLPSRVNQAIITLEDLVSIEMPSTTSLPRRWASTTWHSATIFRPNKDDTAAENKLARCKEIRKILVPFQQACSQVRRRYAEDLLKSVEAFATYTPMHLVENVPVLNEVFKEVTEAASAALCWFEFISSHITQGKTEAQRRAISWLMQGGIGPTITPITLLELLRGNRDVKFGSGVKKALVEYGISLMEYQKWQRIYNSLNNHINHSASHSQDFKQVKLELSYKRHENWDPMQYPDWMLLEIEADLIIRPKQVEVALATIGPASKHSSVLQMNMGEGKTSCIIPMAAMVIADGTNLARVSVPRALLTQTGLLLHARLGGLPGRELLHIPFSRRTPSTPAVIDAFMALHKHMKSRGGVMLCLPEHQLSFMLSAFQRLIDDRILDGQRMISTHAWISSCARDIIDESDYTLAVSTQLVYPSGNQVTVDGHPHRWLVAEQLLGALRTQIFELKRKFPQSIDVIPRKSGGFPFIFFLRADAEAAFLERLRTDICSGRLGIIPMRHLSPEDQVAIQNFLTNPVVDLAMSTRIKKLCPQNPDIRKKVYLLRGLMVNRILMMTLKKRWNVQYGLHQDRDPIAVPYHAKGVPSEMSEWGHPDVAILLTILSFYYSGVSIAQLREALEHVFKSDDPCTEYDSWVASCDASCDGEMIVPGSLRDWSSINLDDSFQLQELHNLLCFNTIVVDYYLNNFVFPRHSKQFEVKLQSNGWDIPIFRTSEDLPETAPMGMVRHVTTGFSGTNDNRHMLPLTIKQEDLPSLSHTNAEVLSYLLEERCQNYTLLAYPNGRRKNEWELLDYLTAQRIMVLIDAGAQILEMTNEVVARTWLTKNKSALAALFFGPDNKAYVVTKSPGKTPLLASPFAEDLRQVLIYLDQAHTRGTDLKLPPYAVGALTLGLGQTKDATVQAAMRLRQLGTTQSVVFLATPEVHQSIVDACGITSSDNITSWQVIHWLLDNTCDNIEQLQPLYYSQGMDFCSRMQAIIDFPLNSTEPEHFHELARNLTRQEQQSLAELYGGVSTKKLKQKRADAITIRDRGLCKYVKELKARRKEFFDTGKAVQASALQEVEQEREVTFEIESIRQVKRPLKAHPFTFPGLHSDIYRLVNTGRMPPGAISNSGQSGVFVPAMVALTWSAAGKKTGIIELTTGVKNTIAPPRRNLFVTTEFLKTVKLHATEPDDNFLRPVRFVLWCGKIGKAVLITPEEAEAVLPLLEPGRDNKRSDYSQHVKKSVLPFIHGNYVAQTHDVDKDCFRMVDTVGNDRYGTTEIDPEVFLLVYSPPVTRRMLQQFKQLTFYSCPSLPPGWSPPRWLTIEVGIFGGRLYFEWPEYADICDFLGMTEQTGVVDEEISNGVSSNINTSNSPARAEVVKAPSLLLPALQGQQPIQPFATKMLTFLKEWLSNRRKGQDIAHTPMGYVVHGKPLDISHPFFRYTGKDDVLPLHEPRMANVTTPHAEFVDSDGYAESHSIREEYLEGESDECVDETGDVGEGDESDKNNDDPKSGGEFD